MRHHHHTLSFAPRPPDGLSRLSFGIRLQGRGLRVTATAASASYVLLDGQPLRLPCHGQQITATIGDPQPHPIPNRRARATPTQPHGRAPARRRPAHASGTSTDR